MFCSWLDSRPADERADWITAMTDKRIRHSTILRSARARGYTGTSDDPIRKHRVNEHGATTMSAKHSR